MCVCVCVCVIESKRERQRVCVCVCFDSATPSTTICQAPLSVGFPSQEYWDGLPFSPPGNLPDPGVKPSSPALQADSLPLSYQGSPSIHN